MTTITICLLSNADNLLEYFVDYFKHIFSRGFAARFSKERELSVVKLSMKIFISLENLVREYAKRLDEQLNGKIDLCINQRCISCVLKFPFKHKNSKELFF